MGDFALPKQYTEVNLLYIPPPPEPVKAIKKSSPKPVKKNKTPLPEQGNLLTEQVNKLSKIKEFQGTVSPVELPDDAFEKELDGLLPEADLPIEDVILPAAAPLPANRKISGKIGSLPAIGKRTAKSKGLSSQIGIEWAGPPRRFLHQPPIPKYSSKTEGEVRLKFWVDPAGKVSNVLVMQKLDTNLEQLSMQYMKKWLFEPLRPDVEQTLQWGTITIRFRRD